VIDHIGLRTARFESSKQFFISVLAPLGVTPTVEYSGGVGFARGDAPTFWLGESSLAPSSMHVAFQAPSRAAVDAFYAAALAAGATDNGGPGIRADYHANYYAAFVIGLDGNNVEAVCHLA
jgi:catechol 2,3-dioxygenase-like lactoylglutathione lyase family enzyme